MWLKKGIKFKSKSFLMLLNQHQFKFAQLYVLFCWIIVSQSARTRLDKGFNPD